ncbi:MAG: site-specific tyrosine recombinase XerD [Leptonema sp. (in: bacteria)]
MTTLQPISEQNKDYIQEFQEYLIIEKNLSKNTLLAYTQDLKKYMEFIKKNNLNLLQVTKEEIINFLKDTKIQEISTRSLVRMITTLRQFYYFLLLKHYINYNPTEKIEIPKIQKNLPDYLTMEEIQTFFSVFDLNNIFELRDRCIFEIMYVSGLRISEVCDLKLSDVDFLEMEIKITGKGNKQRIVPFGEQTGELLKRYLNESRNLINKKVNPNKTEYLFVSKKGEKLDRKSIWKFLQKYTKKSGILRNISPHTFRHSFATHMIQNNADLRVVQELLGHRDISTTQIYTHLDKKHLKEAHKKYHPRG